MRVNVMKKGERVIGVMDNKILLENKKGEVRIIRLVEDDDGIRIDNEEVLISYGDGSVVVGDMDEGIEVTIF